MTKTVKKSRPSKKAKITAARFVAVQCVYQMALADLTAKQAFDYYHNELMGKPQEGDDYVPADLDLLSKILTGVSDNRDELRPMLLGALEGQKPEPLLQAVLFCGLYELMRHAEAETAVIINDYLNITDGFYDQSEKGLVNAILDRQAKNLRP